VFRLDLDLALIGFPKVESEKLMNEVKKEMRLPNEGYLSSLFSNQRVRFFDKDVDESWRVQRSPLLQTRMQISWNFQTEDCA
jgi:hypothetical protein